MPWGRRVRKLCRAAAGGGSPGGGTLQGDEAWCRPGPGSGLCSPVEHRAVPAGHSGTGSLGGSPLSLEAEAEVGSLAGSLEVQAACWGAGGHWGLEAQGGTEVVAWSDGRSHRELG